MFAAWIVFVVFPCAAVAQKNSSVDTASLKQCLPAASGATGEEGRFTEEIKAVLQNTANGQAILRGVLMDCPSKGPVLIATSGFKGSFIFNDRGVESIAGERGREDDEHSPRAVFYNRLFLKFMDHAAGVSFAAAVVTQELARMIVHDYLKSSFEGYTDVLGFALAEEQYARTKGYLVAFESSAAVTGATLEGADFSSNPQAFLDRLKLHYDCVLMLQQRELRSPIDVYERRLKDLDTLADQQRKRGRDIPLLLDQLDHALHYIQTLSSQRPQRSPHSARQECQHLRG